ncbi:MAG: PPE domain-containing protein [Sciscionella sp.]
MAEQPTTQAAPGGAGNPLVAGSAGFSPGLTGVKDPGNVAGGGLNADTAGAGPLADAAATITDAVSGDWGNLALDGVTDGLDLLGAAMDPLGTLASAGVGWLIEHIGFLKKGLDELAGDPAAVTAHAQTWTNIANQLKQTGSEYQQSTSTLAQSYRCTSAQAYGKTAKDYVSVLHGAAATAESASKAMKVGATLVGVERGIIRDMTSEFVGGLIAKALAALALSWCSFGGSVAAFIADSVIEGGILAEKIAGKIEKLISKLEALAKGAKSSSKTLETVTGQLRKFKGKLDDLTDSSVTTAAGLERRADGLNAKGAQERARFAAKDPNKTAAENKVNEWNGRSADHTVGAASDGVDRITGNRGKSTYDHVKEFHERNQEKSVLEVNEWKKAARHTTKDGSDFHPPKWNNADSVVTVQEAGRQQNEQADRSREVAESYEQHQPERGEELKSYEDYQWPTQEPR